MRHSYPITHLLTGLFCSLLLAGCGGTLAASVLPRNALNLADALNRPWTEQEIERTGLQIAFPDPLTVHRMGSGPDAYGMYELSATGSLMYALVRPYDGSVPEGEGLSGLRAASATEDICRLLAEDPTYPLGIDFSRPNICRVMTTGHWKAVTGIGFTAGADVTDMNGVILLLGPDRTVIVDHIFTLRQLSPIAQAMIDDYFAEHPQVTRLWPGESSVKALDRRLKRQLEQEINEPSVWIKNAEAYLEQMAAGIH